MEVNQEETKGCVLVVDDNPLILETLQAILRARNFDVFCTDEGEVALGHLKNHDIDVVISDVMMPSMDGYQFHNNVRNDPALCHVPFIFLTALDDVKEVTRGNQAGCDNYLTKPFDPHVLLSVVEGKVARSRALRQVMQETQDNYRKRVVQTLSHEFRTPLVAINTGSEILREQRSKLDDKKVQNLIDAIYRGGQRLERLVQDFMTLQHIEAGMAARIAESRRQRVSSRRLLKDFFETYREDYRIEGRSLLFIETGSDVSIDIFEAHLQDILGRLVQNAFKFSPQSEPVELWCEESSTHLSIVVADRGQGISAEHAHAAIDAFRQLNRDKIEQQGAGLGLFIADSLSRMNGGELIFEERSGGGTLVSIRFKL